MKLEDHLREIEIQASRAQSAADEAAGAPSSLESAAEAIQELIDEEKKGKKSSVAALIDFINCKLTEVGIYRHALITDDDLVLFAREMLDAHVRRAKEAA